MLISLIPLAFLLHYLILKRRGSEPRLAVLTAASMLGGYVVVSTEILSAVHSVTGTTVAVSWALVCVIAAIVLWVQKPAAQVANSQGGAGSATAQSGRGPVWLWVGISVLKALVGITALVNAPNVWDAMEYHLPRVSMWMSNHSVAFYPTPDYAQLIFGPWAEFSMMHTYLLWGSDRFVNFVEFFSFLGCMVGASYAAKLLGAGWWGQSLAAVIAATIPEGVLEASGPMNIYVVSFWILATVVFLLRFNEQPTWSNAVLVGTAAGLAILTKGSAYVYLPFLVLGCWLAGNSRARVEFCKKAPVFLLLIFSLNGMQYVRCYQLTGSPLGLPFPDGGPRLHWMVSGFGVRELAANAIRNASLHTVTPLHSVNEIEARVIRRVIHFIGVDPDDQSEVWIGYRFELNNFSVHEVHAGNPLHFLLALFCGALAIVNYRRLARKRAVVIICASLLASFLMFCGLLRWQLWGARHHLPLFVLAAVLCGVLLEEFVPRKYGVAVVAICLAYALTFSMVNRTRALLPWSRVADIYKPRAVQYFADQHEDQAVNDIALAKAVDQLPCRSLAIDAYTGLRATQLTSKIYPFFIFPILALTHVDGRYRTARYVAVDNLSARFSGTVQGSPPCTVICLDCAEQSQKWDEYGHDFPSSSVFGRNVVFYQEPEKQ
jgi:Dolichyl-phosphate-mannose-protein mannosyltransferase